MATRMASSVCIKCSPANMARPWVMRRVARRLLEKPQEGPVEVAVVAMEQHQVLAQTREVPALDQQGEGVHELRLSSFFGKNPTAPSEYPNPH